jgi:hypothetical protein
LLVPLIHQFGLSLNIPLTLSVRNVFWSSNKEQYLAKSKKYDPKNEMKIPELKIVKSSEKSVETNELNTGCKTTKSGDPVQAFSEEIKVEESKAEKPLVEVPQEAPVEVIKPKPKPEPIDIELAKKHRRDYNNSNCESSNKGESSRNQPDQNIIKPVKIIASTPEVNSKKFIIGTQDSSNEEEKSDKDKVSKFTSGKQIKNLLKFDSNSSAINLLSPNNQSNFMKSKRKASGGMHGHPDGASIVSANLSSEMGTACFQGSARLKSATSRNESPDYVKEIEMTRQLHDNPMSYIEQVDVIFK